VKLASQAKIMVQIFLDTASLNEIEEISSWGLIDGVTTNQKIFLAEGGVDFRKRVLDICNIVEGPISVETTKHGVGELLDEAREYASWHKNIVIKVAMFGNGDGLRVVNQLSKEGIRTNMTVMMTFNQLVLATKAGATFVSLFYNRAREAGENPDQIIRDYASFVKEGGYCSRLIVGSIRTPNDVSSAIACGAHVMTIPTKILKMMPFNKRTEETIAEFDQAWVDFLAKKAPQKVAQ
jgi:transaldolase